jgi:hypothetical protein
MFALSRIPPYQATAISAGTTQPIGGGTMKSSKRKKVAVAKQTRAEKRAAAIKAVQKKADAIGIEFFHDGYRKAYCTVPVADHRETWKVRSRDFRLWVMQTLYDSLGAAPKTIITEVLEEYETRAICKGKEIEVHVRIAEHDGVTYIDLCNSRWQVLEVTPKGWSVLDESPVKFRRASGMTELPIPKAGLKFRDISKFLNVGAQSEVLLLSWLTYALRPNLPYPIIALSGVQGAGKSTISKVLRSLIDPSLAALTTIPKSERDVAIAATNSHLIAMDNLSEISAELSDILCRVATGGSFRTRELYTNDDEVIFTYRRPLIINGIEELPIRPDLLDRSILIHVEPITEDRRQDEQKFWSDFERVRPQIFGRMLDIICDGIRRLPDVKLETTPRMADFTRWGVAVEQAMGFAEGSFLSAYSVNREDANAAAIESSPIAVVLHHYLGEKTTPYGSVEKYRRFFDGTALKLLDELRKHCDHQKGSYSRSGSELWEVLHHPKFPKTASAMSAEIARIEPNLKKLHVTVERGRTHNGRYLKIVRTDIPVVDSDEEAALKSVAKVAEEMVQFWNTSVRLTYQGVNSILVVMSGRSEPESFQNFWNKLEQAGWHPLNSVKQVVAHFKKYSELESNPPYDLIVERIKRDDAAEDDDTTDTGAVTQETAVEVLS